MKYFFLAAVLLTSHLCARDVVDESGSCQINWTQGYITCSSESEAGQSRYKAKTAAKVIVQRDILEVIKGVKVDSVTTVQDGLISSDIIRTRVEGVIRGAQILSNVYNDAERYSVATARIYMGKDLLSALLSDPTQLSWNEKIGQFWDNFSLISSAYASTYNASEKETLNKILDDLQAKGDEKGVSVIKSALIQINQTNYSGILIDVSNLADFQKAMIVKLVDEEGTEYYPAQKISKRTLTKRNTSVGYMFGFDDARNDKRVFNSPLEIKASKVYKNKKSNIVLTKKQIEQINSLENGVFEQAKIILVLGD